MEFGRVAENELDNIDFSLPQEPVFNQQILPFKKNKKPNVYLGCAKWGRAEWIGKIYPEKAKEKDFLQHYVQHYNSIELNATHYKIYGASGIEKWAEKAANMDFKFCPKMYQGVTHRGSLNNKQFITDEFLRGVIAFEKSLGPIFIQVSDTFSPKRKDELFAYLKTLPTDLSFFIEVRHTDWFVKDDIREELLNFLKDNKMGFVITDTAGRRDVAHLNLTLPKAFIRYVGNSLHKTDYTRIDEWIEKMKYWINSGIVEIYFFMHMHDEAFSPELTVYLVDKLNAECGLNLIKPKFVERQQSLF
ncbi:MAG: DUF72 domain-containing protein [Bacteroidetes bacterium]|nr:DUF72 domain-containing protein [Bacteroidota bacterium]